jgi:hypothetical protein
MSLMLVATIAPAAVSFATTVGPMAAAAALPSTPVPVITPILPIVVATMVRRSQPIPSRSPPRAAGVVLDTKFPITPCLVWPGVAALAAALVDRRVVKDRVQVDEDPVEGSVAPFFGRRALRQVRSSHGRPVEDRVGLDAGDEVGVQRPHPGEERSRIVLKDRALLDPVELAAAAEDGLDGVLVFPGVEGQILKGDAAIEAPSLRPPPRRWRPSGERHLASAKRDRAQFQRRVALPRVSESDEEVVGVRRRDLDVFPGEVEFILKRFG